MRLLRWPALLLVAALWGGCSGASSQSLRYFYTGVSEAGQGLPWFVAVGFVDGQRFYRYDSGAKRSVPAAPWMKTAEEDPQYWERETQILQGSEAAFRGNLATAMQRHNQSAGFHTLQLMYGCELSEDGPSKGYYQYSYDGRDFLALDKETVTWTAAVVPAEISKNKLEKEPAIAQRYKVYLEEICTEWLQKYLGYGGETLPRKVPPVVKVTRKESREGLETLLCRAHGFYPKEIDATWRRDGEARQGDTFRGVVSPNADGTYYTWLSIEVDPQERSRFQCHVEHDGLEEPLDVAVEESGSSMWLIAVGVVVVLLVLAVAGVFFYIKQRPKKAAYKAAPGSDKGSDCSDRVASSPPGV